MTDPATTGIVNATSPASLTLPLGTTLAGTITSGSYIIVFQHGTDGINTIQLSHSAFHLGWCT
jgi:hypothetical protein